jgi:hypothetical protein
MVLSEQVQSITIPMAVRNPNGSRPCSAGFSKCLLDACFSLSFLWPGLWENEMWQHCWHAVGIHAVGPLLACALLFCRCVLMFNIVGFATFVNYVLMLNDVFLGIGKLCVLAHIGT